MHTCGKCKRGSHCEVRMRLDAEENRAAGRAAERAAIVRYLRVWADSVRDNEAIDGRLQALVTDTHAGNIESGEHITRPDRANGGA